MRLTQKAMGEIRKDVESISFGKANLYTTWQKILTKGWLTKK